VQVTAKLIDPSKWISAFVAKATKMRADHSPHPLIYVAHPVAARNGEVLATCTTCDAERSYGPSDPVDLHRICECDTPVATTGNAASIVEYNLRRAMRWWQSFHLEHPDAVFTMPWYVNVTANGEGDLELVRRGLRDDCAIVERCDALVLCGVRVSSGMRLEADAAVASGLPVFQVPSATPSVDRNHPSALWQEWIP
jgi:hypothetical protein